MDGVNKAVADEQIEILVSTLARNLTWFVSSQTLACCRRRRRR